MRLSRIQNCAKCGSDKLRFKPEEGKPHHGRLICGVCGGFIAWVSKDLAKFLSRFVIGDDKKGGDK